VTQSDAHALGVETRRRAIGDATISRMAQSVYGEEVIDRFVEYATEADLETRTLVSVVTTATQGWTEDELTEVLLHLAGYVGLPTVREAMLTAKETFAAGR
jgi:4-carboxymuconolactone decarboxylase